jgi:hypothetical protein
MLQRSVVVSWRREWGLVSVGVAWSEVLVVFVFVCHVGSAYVAYYGGVSHVVQAEGILLVIVRMWEFGLR